MADWLRSLSTPPPAPPVADLEQALAHWERDPGGAFDRAVTGGGLVDRVGLAFAAGYRSALLALTGQTGTAALCVTEEGGNHPRAIQTRLTREDQAVVLTGTKAWSTLAGRARTLLIAASAGHEDGRNRLRMVEVPVDAEGLELRAMPPTPFTPEIPHFQVELREVRVCAEAVLDGDGYDRWIKPFRSVEDIHVIAAIAAHVVATGRRADWPAALVAEGIATIAALASLASRPPLDPEVHLALGGVLAGFEGWIARTEEAWSKTAPEIQRRWSRDRPLLQIAGKARAARFARAATAAGLTVA